MFFTIKIFTSAFIIAAISEIGKRSGWLAALLASLPLVSLLSMVWIYYETKDIAKTTEFAKAVPPLVIPSLAFFFAFVWLAKTGMNFWISMAASIVIMLALYAIFLFVAAKMGMKI